MKNAATAALPSKAIKSPLHVVKRNYVFKKTRKIKARPLKEETFSGQQIADMLEFWEKRLSEDALVLEQARQAHVRTQKAILLLKKMHAPEPAPKPATRPAKKTKAAGKAQPWHQYGVDEIKRQNKFMDPARLWDLVNEHHPKIKKSLTATQFIKARSNVIKNWKLATSATRSLNGRELLGMYKDRIGLRQWVAKPNDYYNKEMKSI